MQRPRLPEPFTFFVDECLGRRLVPDALRVAVEPGERVLAHHEVFAPGVADEVWLKRAGLEGWAAITQDARLQHRPNELAALLEAGTAVILVRSGTGATIGRLLAEALPTLRRVLRSEMPPVIARVDGAGGVLVHYSAGVRVKPARHVLPRDPRRV